MDIWGDTKIDFLGKRKITAALSAILVVLGLVSVISLFSGGGNLGTDFTGGVAVQFRFEEPYKIDEVRGLFEASDLKDADLQQFADETKLLVRVKRADGGDLREVSASIGEVFNTGLPSNPYIVDSTTEVGPTVGKKLQSDALSAISVALLGILLYVAWRFEFRFGVAAVAATFHDIMAVVGILYILDKEINLLIVTALLTLAGYSLTDTVVVFDRIRENIRKDIREKLLPVVNRSINEVLRRTVVTSLTTLLVLVVLFFRGGEVIHDFSLTLCLGVLVGTYSSIFVASPMLLVWKGTQGKLVKSE